MAHMIETMAYAGQVPWHGLGAKVSEGISIEDMQKAAGLDWTVSKRPVNYSDLVYKDRFVIARDTDDKPYSVVSERYKPVQPREILEVFRDLLERNDMTLETAGSLGDGRRIWALAKTGDTAFIKSVDQVNGYLLLATSYDLTFSTLAQFTSVRVVCNNTLTQAIGHSTGRVTVPHFCTFDADKVTEALGVGREQWAAFAQTLHMLADVKLDAAKAQQVMEKVMEVPHASNVVKLFDEEAYVGADIAGRTAWGLVNATTEYIDFRKRARSQNNRLDSAWFGEGAAIKDRTVNELVLLAA